MENIGQRLREVRMQKGLSLKDVNNATKIRIKYLQAIEEGKFSEIPGEVYLKGFIKNYANFLRLNGSEFLKEYRLKKEEEKNKLLKEKEEKEKNEQKEVEGWINKIQDKKLFNIGLIGFLIIIVVFVSYSVFLLNTARKNVESISQGQNEIVQDQKEQSLKESEPVIDNEVSDKSMEEKKEQSEPGTVNNEKQTEAKILQPDEKQVDVQIKVKDRTWVRIIVDGEKVMERTLLPGEEYDWQGEEIKMIVGNAGGLDVFVQGEYLGKLGDDGQVLTRIFRLDNKE